MKILVTCALSALLVLCHLTAPAQNIPINEPDYNKPALFSDVPRQLDITVANLEQLLSQPLGAAVQFQFSSGFLYAGTVVSVSNNEQVRSVVIRSTNRIGAAFTVTRVTREDGTPHYIGRIMSLKNSDAYTLVREEENYYLRKTTLYELINE